MQPYKLIVAGGRDFTDYNWAKREIIRLGTVELKDYAVSIVCGMARGADAMGLRFAEEHGVVVHKFYADWDGLGKSAGHARNRDMGNFADGLLAFWDGRSRGTKGMIEYMRYLDKDVRVIEYGGLVPRTKE